MKNYFCKFSVVIICFVYITSIFAFSGWNNVNGRYVYLNEEGKMILNDWRTSDGDTYFLDENGFVVENTLMEINGDIYFFDEFGRRAHDEFITITDANFKSDDYMKNGVYYFDERGKAIRKKGNNFKKKLNGIYFAFNDDGLLYGEAWFDNEGEEISDYASIITEGVYHTNALGIVACNEWYYFSDDIGSAYIDAEGIDNDSLNSESYAEMKDMWMYFDVNCKKVVSITDKAKLKEIRGKQYAFDRNGIMLESIAKNGELSDVQPSNLSLTEKVKVFDVDGTELKNVWRKIVPSKYLNEEDYNDNTASWFYADNSSNLVYNKLKEIDGEKYIFDGIGRMKNGFALMDGKGLFVSNFKPEDLKRDDFVYSIDEGSQLFGSELCDLRYFEPGDDNGKMLTGNIKIELGDGEYEFRFKESTGIAYGNKHELKDYKNEYYINGLKLKPLEDMKYGIVKVSDTEYKIVNKDGKILSGNKKLIKDDYENYMVMLNNHLAGYITDALDKTKLKWCKEPIASISDLSGYYYYNGEPEVKDYVGLAVAMGTECPTDEQLAEIPEEMKLNFR